MSPTRNSLGAAGIAAAMLVGSALAQAPEPVVVSPRPELKWLEFYYLDAALELEYRRSQSKVDPVTGSSTTDTEDRFRELLELSTRGYVGHPNLLQLDLRGGLRFTQRLVDEDTTGIDDNFDEFLFEYDLNGLFFQEQKYPFTVYSRRTQSDIDRLFGGSVEQTWTQTGARLTVRSEVFPTNVEVFVRELEQDDRTFAQDFELDQNTVQADGRINIAPTQRMWWDFTYDDIEESGEARATRSFDRVEANASHTIDFGFDDKHQLRSRLRLFDQSGDRDFQQILWTERLHLRPSRALDVFFDWRLENSERGTVEVRRYDASTNFRHQLFESLVTTGRFGGIHQDIRNDPFESDEIQASLVFDYTKRVPLGTFFAGVGANWDRNWQEERGVAVPVPDNAFTFPPTDLIVIFEENVVPNSIEITDLTGTIVYSLGSDYLQLVLPDRVEIRRVASGFIAPGETVLISYEIGPEPSGRTTTTGLGFNLRYTFDETFLAGLSVFVIYLDQDQKRTPSDFAAQLQENDFTDLRYGLEYNAWNLYLKAEAQNRDSDLSPFDSILLEARYTEPLGRGSSLGLSATYQEIDRTDVDIRTASTTVTGTWNQRITDHLRGSLILVYQNIDSNAGFDTEGFDQTLNLRWIYRQTEVYAQLRNAIRDNDGADDTWFQTITVGLRREF
ncbi:MAG: hypothetical protein ACYS15_05475 [Planctomycetota bacterium]